MELLEYFYDRNNEITAYRQRKVVIDPTLHYQLIYGPPASGKSSLVLDYLMQFDSEAILYIDFRDPKFTFRDVMEEDVEGFIMANDIKVLVLDHYEHEYFERLPAVEQLIIVSDREHDYGTDFTVLHLPLLDYEEFFAFQKRGNETQIFNHFLRQGTLPQLATQTTPKEQLFSTFIRSHFDDSEQKLLTILTHFNTSNITIHQLYTYAKERYKISKDLIYKQIKMLTERNVITLIPDALNPSSKKLIFFDFALAKYLTLTQSFPKQFDTMIALSLLKHDVTFKTMGVGGYLTDQYQLIIPAPFESEENLWKKAHNRFGSYKKNGVQKVYIITVTARYEFTIEHITFEALPFYEWVVIHDER